MKKNFKTIFASMLAVLSCASCSQNEGIVSNQDLTPKSLEISLPKTATSRSVEGQLQETAAPKYVNITTIYYDHGGNGVVTPWSPTDITALKQTILDVVKPASVQVIVNIPASQLVDLTAAKTKTAVDVVLANVDVDSQNLEPDGLITSAQQTVYSGLSSTITTVNPGIPTAVNEVEVAISSIASRFEIGAIKAGTGLTALTIEKVFFNNYLTLNDKASLIVNIPQNSWGGANPTELWAGIEGSPLVTSAVDTKAYAFQAFSGNVIPQIIFKVGGTVADGYKLADGTTGNFTGKFITIKGFKLAGGTALTALAPHKIYQVAVGAPLSIAVEEITPEPNQDEVGLQVTIKVLDWTKETLTPEVQ